MLGTAGLGMAYGLPAADGGPPEPPSIEAAVDLLRAALSAGIGGFDSAPAYGEAEAVVGRALAGTGVVWTKLDHRLEPGPGLSGRAFASLGGSLGRLQRERVDLLQWHNWTATLAQDPWFVDCWRGLAGDRRVGALGATTYGPDDASAAVESGLFSVVQVEWNLLNQRVVRTIAPRARARGVRIAARSVLLRGVLTPKGDRLPDGLAALVEPRQRAVRVAAELGVSLPALALRAALDEPDISFVLVGTDRREQLDEALAAAMAPALPPEVWSRLRELEAADPQVADPRHWT